MTAATDPHHHAVSSLIGRVRVAADQTRISVADMVDAVGRDGFAAILLIPALAVATPLSGIPLFSSVMGIFITIVAAQMLSGRQSLWLPRWLLRLRAAGPRVDAAFARLTGLSGWIDRHTHPRLTWVTRRPLVFVPQILCLLSGLVMPLLEFVPFSSSLVGSGVALLALGMLVRDGVVIALALIPYAGVIWLIVSFITSI